ncbi:MAG: hypothetical protein K2G90_04575, partial [Muribaculaceae bacterium]|nr:hypothetical protein [Muribaculaceae bacterium]
MSISMNKLGEDYVNSIEEKLTAPACLPDEIRDLARDFINYKKYGVYGENGNDFPDKIATYARQHDIEDVALLFEGELQLLTQFLLGEEWSELWKLYMKAEAQTSYTHGYYRRSVRSRRIDLHVSEVVDNLRSFFELKATGFSTADILRGGRSQEEIKDLNYEMKRTAWLTAMIMAGDKECIDWLIEAMTSENNANRMNYSFFRAIVMSGNKELLELEGKLLLAARLQEGLRQAIVETMDEGTTESYRYLLQVIVDNNLQRFAAVKRGLAVTTGLDESEAPERITDKYISLVHRYVNDREAALRGVESEDAMEIYLALWALAFFNADDVRQPIERLIDSAPSYRVQAAMLALAALQHYTQLCTGLASSAIRKRHDDHAIIAGALPMYLMPKRPYYRYYYSGYNSTEPSLNDFFSSRKEAEADFETLTAIIDSMKGDETFAPYVFPWNAETLTRSALAQKLASIASLLNDLEYTERSLQYVNLIDSYPRAMTIKEMMRKMETPKMIEFVVKGMADRATEVRDVCCEITKRLHDEGKLGDSEYKTMEDHL